MNKVLLIGRATDDPKVVIKEDEVSHARYTLAVDRYGEGADFISCVAFKKQGEFAQKYIKKGTRIAIEGHIQTGSYTKQDGTKAYTTDVIVERHEFCDSKRDTATNNAPVNDNADPVSIPEGVSDLEGLPFK